MIIDFSKGSPFTHTPSNEFETKVLDFLNEWFSPSKTVKVQTSGSTGKPKVFDIEKSKMINSATMTCDFLELEEENSALLCLPVEYISGKMMLVRSLTQKLILHISQPSLHPLEELNTSIDFCAMTPLQVEHALEKLHLIKKIIIGGAAVSENLKKKIHQHLKGQSNTIIYETYGMSETLSHIALKQVYPLAEDWFTTFANVEINTDERGCLNILAPKVNSELLQTNDLVEIKNGNQFRFLGRIDNVINSGGAKIFPEQLESLVKKAIPNEVVFLGKEDDVLGQKLILIVEGEASETLKETIKIVPFEKKFHHPKEIIFIHKMPRTPNGKVSRPALKKWLDAY